MGESHGGRLRLMKIVEMLRTDTDAAHPMRTRKVLERLHGMDISCDRRTLYKDVVFLNEQGYAIASRYSGHEKAFYMDEKSFSLPELKILMDAVQAAGFVTESKTEELVEKIANLGGCHRANLLKSNLVKFNARKHTNESIFSSVASLEQALQKKQQAAFYYFDLDEHRTKVYRHHQQRYIVEPIALVFQNDKYYLMTHSAETANGVKNYRVDRMDTVCALDVPISDAARAKARSVAHYTGQTFGMYGGTSTMVTLRLDAALIGAVYDQFGEQTKLLRQADGTLQATVCVQLSPTFWAWLFQFADKMKLAAPKRAIAEYRAYVKAIYEGL